MGCRVAVDMLGVYRTDAVVAAHDQRNQDTKYYQGPPKQTEAV